MKIAKGVEHKVAVEFNDFLLVWILKLASHKVQIIPTAECEQSLHEGVRDVDGLVVAIPSPLKVIQISREERPDAHDND